jgi:hypothetical protein
VTKGELTGRLAVGEGAEVRVGFGFGITMIFVHLGQGTVSLAISAGAFMGCLQWGQENLMSFASAGTLLAGVGTMMEWRQ